MRPCSDLITVSAEMTDLAVFVVFAFLQTSDFGFRTVGPRDDPQRN